MNREQTLSIDEKNTQELGVDYRSKRVDTKWLDLAAQIMENPELFDDSNPTIYYHEEFTQSYKPFGFDLKKKILNYLRKKDIKKLEQRK